MALIGAACLLVVSPCQGQVLGLLFRYNMPEQGCNSTRTSSRSSSHARRDDTLGSTVSVSLPFQKLASSLAD